MPVCLFVVPFVGLMSATAKRRARVLLPVCGIVLVGHYLDCYWLVMPAAYGSGPQWESDLDRPGDAGTDRGCRGLVLVAGDGRAAMVPDPRPASAEALADQHYARARPRRQRRQTHG